MSYIASNNGITITWWAAGYVPQSGESDMGAEYPTIEQLKVAFPTYTVPLPPVIPNIAGFINECKTAAGGIVGANALATKYPLFFPAVEAWNWIDVTALIVDAHTNMVLTDAAYAAFKAAATANNIPVKLP